MSTKSEYAIMINKIEQEFLNKKNENKSGKKMKLKT